MGYLVNVTARAERDLALLFEAINAEHSGADGCSETPENAGLRHLLYGHKPHVYRVIYRVTEKPKQVDVLHLRHGARRRFSRTEVSEP